MALTIAQHQVRDNEKQKNVTNYDLKKNKLQIRWNVWHRLYPQRRERHFFILIFWRDTSSVSRILDVLHEGLAASQHLCE